jgi:hypothetical protein
VTLVSDDAQSQGWHQWHGGHDPEERLLLLSSLVSQCLEAYRRFNFLTHAHVAQTKIQFVSGIVF